MHLHSKLLAVSSLWVFCAVALPAVADPVSLSELKTQLHALSSVDAKLDFLRTALRGQSDEVKAALGAALIERAPADSQKRVANRVGQLFGSFKGSNSSSANLLGMLTAKLPRSLAASLAGTIAIGAGISDPEHLPQITAAVIASQSGTIENAGAIAGEVTASAPLDKATSIASAIGAAFVDHAALAKQAPEIAAAITRSLLPKGTLEQTRPEIANSVAALTVLLPGSIRGNKELITRIGQAVAAVIAERNTGMATTIVGITSAALKSAAGSSEITDVLNSFKDAFSDTINDAIIKDKLTKVVSDINAGTSDKSVLPLEPQIKGDAPTPPADPPPVGPIITPETNVKNQ